MKRKILVCSTGSVATIKIPELVNTLLECDFEVKLIATKRSVSFLDLNTLSVPLLTDDDEWNSWRKRGDPILHIELCDWADILLIAPLSANTLGKLANGICDNLVSCVARAWPSAVNVDPDEKAKPFLFAPAMNTRMWRNPLTKVNIDSLRTNYGGIEIPTATKMLMCGKYGDGAMAKLTDIVDAVMRL